MQQGGRELLHLVLVVETEVNVSVIVPFRDEPGTPRKKNWNWLKRRWKALYPGFELVIGEDDGMPFSKSAAVNDGYLKSSGELLIVCDADSFVEPQWMAPGIDAALAKQNLVIPWCNSYRLRQEESEAILKLPAKTPEACNQASKDAAVDFKPAPATAAMCFLIQRTAFEKVGGMDPRFRGWGSEDVAFAMACATLLEEFKIMVGEAWALWHPRPRNRNGNGTRIWAEDEGERNKGLVFKYRDAFKNIPMMAKLCAEHSLPGHPIHVPTPSGMGSVGETITERAYEVLVDGDRIVV